jgi:hypothetical protein
MENRSWNRIRTVAIRGMKGMSVSTGLNFVGIKDGATATFPIKSKTESVLAKIEFSQKDT